MLPLLTVESIAVGIGAGYLVGVYLLGIDAAYFWHNMLRYTHDVDLVIGLIKAFIFGGIIALIGCYKGLTCGLGRGRRRPRDDRGGGVFLHHHPDHQLFPHAGPGQTGGRSYD